MPKHVLLGPGTRTARRLIPVRIALGAVSGARRCPAEFLGEESTSRAETRGKNLSAGPVPFLELLLGEGYETRGKSRGGAETGGRSPPAAQKLREEYACRAVSRGRVHPACSFSRKSPPAAQKLAERTFP